MLWLTDSRLRRTVAIGLALALSVSACGSDDDVSSPEPSDQTATSAGSPADDGLADNSDLVVPLDFLQGEWCSSDGEAWLFEGETARFGENHDELIGALPVADALAAGSQRVLISQSDDEFVLDLQTREVTFTRGRC